MNIWETELATIKQVKFDYDLHVFDVYNKEGNLLGTIYPHNVIQMTELVADLDAESCPIADGWEDGNGNTCTLEGWGKND